MNLKLLKALIIRKLADQDKLLASSLKKIEKQVDKKVFDGFEELNAEQKLQEILNSLQKDFGDKVTLTLEEIKEEYNGVINSKTETLKKELIQAYEKAIKGIPKPKDGKDYKLTDKDLKNIAKLVDVPVVEKVVEIKESPETPEGVKEKLETLKGDNRLDASAIKNLPKESQASGGVGGVRKIRAGENITVDNSNPSSPVISSTGGGGSSVSVNGAEVTDPDFIDSSDIDFDATGSDVTASFADKTGHSVLGVSGGSSAPPASISMGSHSALIRNGGNVEATNAGTNEILRRATGNTLEFGKATYNMLDTGVQNSLDLADSSSQPGDNVSDFANDAGYLTSESDTLNDVANRGNTTGSSVKFGGFGGTVDGTVHSVQKQASNGRYKEFTDLSSLFTWNEFSDFTDSMKTTTSTANLFPRFSLVAPAQSHVIIEYSYTGSRPGLAGSFIKGWANCYVNSKGQHIVHAQGTYASETTGLSASVSVISFKGSSFVISVTPPASATVDHHINISAKELS